MTAVSFQQSVAEYMTSEVERVGPGTRLPEVARMLERCNISSVPVTDRSGRPFGVVSRTDLLRVSRRSSGPRGRGPALHVPDVAAMDVMTRDVQVVHRLTSLALAAERLWRERLHRLYVVEDQQVIGVLSTTDIAAAVRDAGVPTAIQAIMTTPIRTIETTATLEQAVAQLDASGVSGLIVVEDGWPVGVFTQIEALAARDLPGDTRVEDVFDQAVICLPAQTRIFRAAAQVARLEVRRVVVCRQREAIGVVGGLDFARVAGATALAA